VKAAASSDAKRQRAIGDAYSPYFFPVKTYVQRRKRSRQKVSRELLHNSGKRLDFAEPEPT
jgi:hypothetical protein